MTSSTDFRPFFPCITPPNALQEVQDTWPELFNSSSTLRNNFNDALARMGMTDYFDWDDIPDNWDTVCKAFSDNDYSFDVTAVAGASTAADSPKLYALPTYGWDAGNAIETNTLNLKMLSGSSIFCGPGANLVMRDDPRFPGIALHFSKSEQEFLIQIF